MTKKARSEVITFKVDAALADVLHDIPNRSEFIRAAVLSALASRCPLCQGTGILTPGQQKHWDQFAEDHTVKRCDDCHEMHITCVHDTADV